MSAGAVQVAELPLPAEGFDDFVYPRHSSLLHQEETAPAAERCFAVGAWLEGVPAGVALFSRPFGESARRLLSINVRPALRRAGLGSRLLALGEQCAAARGTTVLSAVHSSQLKAIAAYEALMRASGWSPPSEFEFRLVGRAGWSLHALDDWSAFLERLRRRGFGATPWSDLTTGERAAVAELVHEARRREQFILDPFETEARLKVLPELSLVLRRHDVVVGWILGSSGAWPDSVYYSDGWVLPSLRRAGWLPGGVHEVSLWQARKMGRESHCLFETSSGNTAMRRFMERQLKPYSEWTDSRFICEKQLGPARSEARAVGPGNSLQADAARGDSWNRTYSLTACPLKVVGPPTPPPPATSSSS